MAKNPAQQLIEFGQSVWYDNISRDLLDNGELKKLRDECGVRGLTSNPTIFDQAIRGSATYDAEILRGKQKGLTTDQIFEEIAVADIGRAADLLRPVYDESAGEDGFVSIEVSPLLAADTNGTVSEAIRLHKKLSRPNIMIKVPGTPEGIPAVRQLLASGISVNITLLFSVENYIEVAQTYCEALRSRVARGEDVSKIRSVASFFVSRVDSSIDAELDKIAKASSDPAKAQRVLALKGKFAIANSKIAYKAFQNIFETASFGDLKAAQAKPQRPLWASTSTKNPSYRDVIYVEELIGPNTVNTMPHNTLIAFADHGKPRKSVTEDVSGAEALQKELGSLGVNISAALHALQVDGVKKFSESFRSLNEALDKKLAA